MERLFQRVAAAALFAAALLAGLPAGAECADGQVEVKEGETIFSIAKRELGDESKWGELKYTLHPCGRGGDECLWPGECVTLPVQVLPPPPKVDEVCDDVDNDNDGQVDEELTVPDGQSCDQRGVCFRTQPTCLSGGWVCEYPTQYQYEETTCDDLDNDCDGEIDEHDLCRLPDMTGGGHLFFGGAAWTGLLVPTYGGTVGFEFFGPTNLANGLVVRLAFLAGQANPPRGLFDVADTLPVGIGVGLDLFIGGQAASGFFCGATALAGGQWESEEQFIPRTGYFSGGLEAGTYLGESQFRLAVGGMAQAGNYDPTVTSRSSGGRPQGTDVLPSFYLTLTAETPNLYSY